MTAKMRARSPIYLVLTLFITSLIFSQSSDSKAINPDLLKREWNAKWIVPPDVSPDSYGENYLE
jgi:hypothetical protein